MKLRFRDYYSIPKVKVGVVNVGEKTKFPIDDIYLEIRKYLRKI